MPKILITGASGFVGSFLVDEAVKRNYEVWAGIRKSSSKKYLQHPNLNFIDLNYSDVTALTNQLKEFKQTHGKFDYIIHNAGVTKVSKKSDFDKVNHIFTKNFADALIAADMVPAKFILTSSLAGFGCGDAKLGNTVMLSDKANPVNIYGKSKLAAEQYIQSLPNFPYIILRPTGVYGPRELDYYVYFKMMNRRMEAYIGFQEQILTFIYVKDLARLFFEAIDSSITNKAYFVADGKTYTTKEFNNITKKILQKKTFSFKVPIFLVQAIAFLNEKIGSLFGSYPTLNIDKVKILKASNWRCETEPLQKDFGFVAEYDLEKGVKETIEWYKNEKWLK